ncbi:MAG: hypothetical protein Q8M65_10580 [Rhodoglobus sp.]|nr:hypothetical protein [Rhodoglobus sp.]
MSNALAVTSSYFGTGRYTEEDLASFASKAALATHAELVIAGFSCRPVDDDEGKGINYTVGCGCCSLNLNYRKKADGWRASCCVTSAGVIYGDSKINDEYADSAAAAVDHLLTRLEDESELGPVEERGYIHAAHEAIEEALGDWLGDGEETGEREGDDET